MVMRIFVFFNAQASTYEINGEIGSLRRVDGIASFSLLRKAGGDAESDYCIVLDADEAKTDEIIAVVKSLAAQYSGYVSGLKIMAYA